MEVFKTDALRRLQSETLKGVVRGRSPAAIATDLCLRAEEIVPETVCSILVVDRGGRLRPLAGPSLPDHYIAAVNGLMPGPSAGSCGTAAFLGREVVVTDIETDPLWAAYQSLIKPLGFKACWSTPIKADSGRVLGTFAFYYRVSRAPSDLEREIVETCIDLCSIAISHDEAMVQNTRLYQALIEATSDIVWHYDHVKGVTDRRGWAEFTGRQDDPDDFDDWLVSIHPDDREEARMATERAVAARVPLTVEYRLRHHSGNYRWMEDHAVPLSDLDGRITDWVGIISDVHSQKTSEVALRKSEERLRLAIEATGLGTWDLDVRTGDMQWSEEAREILGIAADVPASFEAMLQRVHPDSRDELAHALIARQAQDEARSREIRLEPSGGGERWLEIHSRAILGPAGQPLRRIGALQDISHRKRAEQQVWKAAYTDSLTGVPNRALFQERLSAITEGPAGKRADAGLIVMDLDGFKEVNDSLGHGAGDDVLRTVAETLIAALPQSSTVARLGGDEFGIIVPDIASIDDVQMIAVELAFHLRIKPLNPGRDLDCTGSFGFTTLGASGWDAGVALKNADIALYAAKSAGGGQALAYTPDMSRKLEKRLGILQAAREALATNRVMPFYQPKISCSTGRIIGFEALLRWTDGSGLRSPSSISEAFADADLAVAIGRRMLDRVVADMSEWSANGIAFGTVALNASAPEFTSGGYADHILGTLSQAGLPPSRLEIEVTESVFMDDDTTAMTATLQRLHDAGVSISFDDFGTGFASLTHLTKFPVSSLKIDRSFIANLERDKKAAAIVHALTGMARQIGLQVVAEGVETDWQYRFLKRIRCDMAQGYLFAKPMAASRVPYFIREHARIVPAASAQDVA